MPSEPFYFSRKPSKFYRRNMDRLRRSLRDSFRRRRGSSGLTSGGGSSGGGSNRDNGDLSKPQQWSSDEASVRAGTCSFLVKYLGCVEVFESRGMAVCEEALKILRTQRKHPLKGVLYVSGDGLRVVDGENKGLLVDQTIEKVSFCAPDRHNDRGFAYICRDGTTRRWMCHGFQTTKETGERLSHAVGCAFAVCLDRKQRRDKTNEVTSTASGNTSAVDQPFKRSDFKRATLTERIQDPQNVRPQQEKLPVQSVEHPTAVPRPSANPELFRREGSLRLQSDASPFRRLQAGTSSLRADLTSIMPRSTESSGSLSSRAVNHPIAIPEGSVVTDFDEDFSLRELPSVSASASAASDLSSVALSTPARSDYGIHSTASEPTTGRTRAQEWLESLSGTSTPTPQQVNNVTTAPPRLHNRTTSLVNTDSYFGGQTNFAQSQSNHILAQQTDYFDLQWDALANRNKVAQEPRDPITTNPYAQVNSPADSQLQQPQRNDGLFQQQQQPVPACGAIPALHSSTNPFAQQSAGVRL